jgi:hypothetical protein
MKTSRFLLFATLALTVLLLTYGLINVKQWPIAAVVLVPTALILWARKNPGSWQATLSLILFTALAVYGVINRAAPVLMILSAASALACWDLTLFEHSLVGNHTPQPALFEQRHISTLGLTLSLGLLVAFAGRIFRLQISFWIAVPLVILAFYGMDRLMKILMDSANRVTSNRDQDK